jgi:TPP-dependent pyruvate/acetoin dehydrogenase alpha subunit
MATTVKTKGPTFSPDWRFQDPIAWRDTDLDEKTLKAWFNYILLGRQVDYRFQVLNRQGRAPFIISCAGHEAAQIGVSWPLTPKYDWVSPYYRDVVLARLPAYGRDPSRPDALGAGRTGGPPRPAGSKLQGTSRTRG